MIYLMKKINRLNIKEITILYKLINLVTTFKLKM